MANLSLYQIFGANAYQNNESLVIDKRDFSNLSVNTINKGESLLVAILVRAYEQFNGAIADESNNFIKDEQNRPVSFDNSKLYNLVIELWKVQLLNSKIQHTFLVHSLIEAYATV